jgi:hypothetical protein
MEIRLSERERELLLRVLDEYYSSLREEIYKTEAYQVKEELKIEEAAIKGLLDRLRN